MTLIKPRNPGCRIITAPAGTLPSFLIPTVTTGGRKEGWTVGRSEASDFVVKDDYISSKHIVFWMSAEGAYAADLKSRNLSHRNEEAMRPGQPYLLQEGDELSLALGSVRMVFTNHVSTEASRPDGNGIYVDSMGYEVYVGGHIVRPRIIAKEFAVLDLLFGKKGLVVPMKEIKKAGWPERVAVGNEVGNEEVHQLIKRIRRHIGDDPTEGDIQNIRGLGYKLR